MAATVSSAAAQSPPLVSTGVYAQHLMDSALGLDPGRGIVALRSESDAPPGAHLRDSLPLYAAPDAPTPVAWFVQNIEATDTEPLIIRASSAVRPNVMEFAYEEAGLPSDSLSADGRWARVIYGFAVSGSPLSAWVSLENGRAARHEWTAILADQPLFFLPAELPAFFDRPNGTRLDIALSGKPRADYVMYPEQQQGDWMRVRVVSPSDSCSENSGAPRTAWIRFLQSNGRPRVWYHTRGC